MAYVKNGTAIKKTLYKALKYITNPDKTDHGTLLTGIGGCSIDPMLAFQQMRVSKAVHNKKDKKQESLSASATISAWLGVTEPAMFGANLKYMYPFVAAITASAVAGLISAAFGVLAGGVGIGGLPAILAIKAQYWPGYILAMAVALFGSFFLTFAFKKIYDKKHGLK